MASPVSLLLAGVLWVPAGMAGASPSLPPAPITLEETDAEGGWFLYRLHEGSLEEMGALFARFAVLRAAMRVEGDLAAVILEGSVEDHDLRAEAGLVTDQEPRRVPRAYLLRRMAPCRAAVGRAAGGWGNASIRVKEVRAWALSRGLQPDAPVRMLFLGDPQDPSSLSWQVVLPVEGSLEEAAPGGVEKEPLEGEGRKGGGGKVRPPGEVTHRLPG